jgi:hypothetical protein
MAAAQSRSAAEHRPVSLKNKFPAGEFNRRQEFAAPKPYFSPSRLSELCQQP